MLTIIFCGDLKYCPYLSRYTERLDKKNIDYKVLFWNRGNFALDLPENYSYFKLSSAESKNKLDKLFDFIKFRKWVIKQIKQDKPQKLILLSTLTGVLLFDQLKKFNNSYIFDIRDYSYEKYKIFRLIERTVITNSFFTTISSKGFKKFLPEYDYVIAHNFNREEMIEEPRFIKKEMPLKIVWNGTVRFFDFQKNYINQLKNDNRFLLVYHGGGTDLEKYKLYCEENQIKNVVFTGLYNNKDKYNLISDAAILNNCYGGRDGDELKYAVSNRYYDGLIYHIPQLVETNGYKERLTLEQGVGISLDADDCFADKLYDYYININEKQFDLACNQAIKDVVDEDDRFIKEIDRFLEYEDD